MKESAGEGGDEEEEEGGSSPFPSDCLSSSTHPGVRVGVTLLWTCRRNVHTLLSLLLLWRESGIVFVFCLFYLCHHFLDFSGLKRAHVTPPSPLALPLWRK